MAKKKKVPQKRDLSVPAMALRGGKGAHVELKKKVDKNICRNKVEKDLEETEN